MNKTKCVICCCVLFFAMASYLGNRLVASPNEIKPEASEVSVNHEDSLDGIRAIEFLGPLSLLDPETALKHGINGYLTINVVSGTPKVISTKRGEARATLVVEFVSFSEGVTEAEVTFGSKNPGTLKIEVPYGSRFMCLNDLVSYEPSGTMKVKVGQILQVKLIIKVPVGYPQVTFPLGAVGATSNVPISDMVDVTVRV